jgi:hypothetical protein
MMTISRGFSIFVPVVVLGVWVFVALSFDFPAPDLTQGWAAVPQGFIFGFMLIPKVLGHMVIAGVSAVL